MEIEYNIESMDKACTCANELTNLANKLNDSTKTLKSLPLPKGCESAAGIVDKIYNDGSMMASLAQVMANTCGVVRTKIWYASTRMPLDKMPEPSSKFGYRKQPTAGASTNHKGIDYKASTGTSVYSVADGVVTISKSGRGYGNYVEVGHDVDGDGNYDFYTRDAHLSERLVNVGDKVSAGEEIGKSGNTGTSSGSHLHFEYRDAEGEPVNPEILLSKIEENSTSMDSVAASSKSTAEKDINEPVQSTVATSKVSTKQDDDKKRQKL